LQSGSHCRNATADQLLFVVVINVLIYRNYYCKFCIGDIVSCVKVLNSWTLWVVSGLGLA
jgi:hypothetical protein